MNIKTFELTILRRTDVVEFLRARLQRNEDPAKMLSDLLHQVVVASKGMY